MKNRRLKVVHINRSILSSNIKNHTNEPTVTARYKSRGPGFKSNNVLIVDDDGNEVARIVCDIEHPLSCGARCYVVTQLRVIDGDCPGIGLV